jgi:hypothetical protein
MKTPDFSLHSVSRLKTKSPAIIMANAFFKRFFGSKIFAEALDVSLALILTALFFFAGGCLYLGPKAAPFDSPMDRRLIEKVPFYPDDTILCGPASLAAVMTFYGRKTTPEEAAAPLIRTNLRGSLAPDLVLWARKMGFKARFWSAKPEEIVALLKKNKPVILQIDSGLAIKTGHFIVAVGYGPEGLVANSAMVQQAITPWAEFLTRWLKFGNLAILVESEEEASVEEAVPAPRPNPSIPALIMDSPL